ncbi:RHS repeat domain-containing protein [Thioalkalivibrio nitratireducens]|nr:RHS repeat-associated core domain-containing protein [Thioalkalivibrio nitratireducens]
MSAQDGDGNRTRIERGSDGTPVAIVAPDSQRTLLAVDGSGYLASVANPAGEVRRFDYRSGGLLTRNTDPRGFVSAYTYDPSGRLVEARNPAGGGWAIVREERTDGYGTRMVSAEGRATLFLVERTSAGEKRRENVHPDGSRDELRFLPDGRRSLVAADGTRVDLAYTPDPRFGMNSPVPSSVSVRTPSGREHGSSHQRSALLADSTDPLSHSQLTETLTTNGRVTQARYESDLRRWSILSPEGRERTVDLDARGRVRSDATPGFEPVVYGYDARGRLAQWGQGMAGERTYGFSYNEAGEIATVTDPLGRVTTFEHDLAGRVTGQVFPDGREVRYIYDASGNLTALDPPGREAHLFEYTSMNREESYHPPDLSGIETVTRYSYDLDQKLTEITRPDGRILRFGYDGAGRLDTVQVERGEYRHRYHASTGQTVSIASPGGIDLALSWDGFLSTGEAWSGPVQGSVTLGYDDNFWATQQSVNGAVVTFQYDSDGLLLRAGDQMLERDARNGLPVASTLGVVNTTWDYNGFGEIQSLLAMAGGEPVARFDYVRDALGRVVEQFLTIDGEEERTTYDYDSAGRLVAIVRNGFPVTYGYDANGNRTQVNGAPIAVYDEQDRMISYGGASYEYTANGELATRTEGIAVTHYSYDELGNLLGVELPDGLRINYLVDGRNRRVGKRVDGLLVQGFLYGDQLNPVAELDASGQVLSRFVYADKPHVPAYMIRAGRTYRILSDQLGSPRLVIDVATGGTVQRIDYDTWGNVLRDTNPGFQPFGFAGGIRDLDTGLVRFGARDYDPATGRWTAKDPIRFAGGDANLYGYVLGDPANLTDPTGQFGLPGAVIGGASAFVGTVVVGGSLGDATINTAVGALAGALPGAGSMLAAVLQGAAAGGASNAVSQAVTIAVDPCRSRSDFNVGSVVGSGVGGALAGGRSHPFGSSMSVQIGIAPSNAAISATTGAIGAHWWPNATR